MPKSITKKTKRRLFLILVFAVTITFGIGYNIVEIWVQIINKNQEQLFLKEELTRLRNEEGHLKNEIQKLQHPDYIARYAREKYLYSRDGEFTLKIP